jgi:hypothetical protein
MTVDYTLFEPARVTASPAVKLFADSFAAEIRRVCAVCRAPLVPRIGGRQITVKG